MIAFLVGSKSDVPRVQKGIDLLEKLGVKYELKVLSAHRNPDELAEYVKSLPERGFEVVIAAAGLAAALPGVVASKTSLPVIGVPLSAGSLGGIDALLSIVQMPKGVPVATVGIDNPVNAVLLALRILALKHPWAAEALQKV